jgi:tRNA dimethylallyltransferase
VATQPTVIIVSGPTAVGKTAMAIQLAMHFNTSIISADSRQCFKELNIGVAKPSPEELNTVPHYFINSHSIHEKVDAAIYERYALDIAEKLFQQHPIAVMTGGTGMYIKAFCEGLDTIPEINEMIQNEVRTTYATNGIEWLQTTVAEEDPEYFANGEILNPQRLMRALEVKRSTGKSIRYFQDRQPVKRPFNIIKIGLQLPRNVLNERIDLRVDKMVSEGLVDEVKQLLPYQHLNALQTVGYKELFDHLNGKLTLPQAIEQIKIHTRQYAKRQMTWFKKDVEMKWFESEDWEGIMSLLKKEPF